MERIQHFACDGVESFAKWTQKELDSQRRLIGGFVHELRPRKRVRRDSSKMPEPPAPQQPTPEPGTTVGLQRDVPRATVSPQSSSTPSPDGSALLPTPAPELRFALRDDGLDFDTLSPPSALPTFQLTGSTLAESLQAVGTAAPAPSTQSVVVVTATPTNTASPSSGMSSTTEAIIIACAIAGAVVIATLLVLLTVCFRRKKRRQQGIAPLDNVPYRMKSSSTLRSDSSESEKQALMYHQTRSRSVSPASRGTSPHGAHMSSRSISGYKPFLDTVPESPAVAQPPSPTSVYPGATPPKPAEIGELQLEHLQPLSPLPPPPLKISPRQGVSRYDSQPNTAMLPSPKTSYGGFRLPFLSGTPSVANDNHRASIAPSMLSSTTEGEPRTGTVNYRRTMESETLPQQRSSNVRWRDSFWSVAASSLMGKDRFKSGYGESMYGAKAASGAALTHSRTNSSTASHSHSHSRGASTVSGSIDPEAMVAPLSARSRSRSSVYSQRRPSDALIPALPPMPTQEEIEQFRSAGSNVGLGLVSAQSSQASSSAAAARYSAASGMTAPPGDFELKGRLHSVDFWAREEREMRLGTFAPAELEGSYMPRVMTPITESTTAGTPRDSMSHVVSGESPHTLGGLSPYLSTGGGYSVAIQGGDGPVMATSTPPLGYSQESDDRRGWIRGRSRERSRSKGRSSSSTVATVFKQHPGDMVMI